MKKCLFLAGAVTFAMSGEVIAQVDYLEYMDKVQIMSEMVHSAKSCEHSKMIIAWNELQKIGDELIADAITNGIDVEFAKGVILESLRKQREKETFLVEFYKKNPDRSNEFFRYWTERCAHLAKHHLTKRFIKYPS